MKTLRDIYWKGRIYYDVMDILYEGKSYPIDCPPFKDGQNVTGLYEVKHQVNTGTGHEPFWETIDKDWYNRAKEHYRRIIAVYKKPFDFFDSPIMSEVKKKIIEDINHFNKPTEQKLEDHIDINGETYLHRNYVEEQFSPRLIHQMLQNGRIKIAEGQEEYFSTIKGKPTDMFKEFLPKEQPNMKVITAIKKQINEEYEASLTDKANQLIDKFRTEIGSSDLHLPEFISGIPMADGSEAYAKAYKDEELTLAEQCALASIDDTLYTLHDLGYGIEDAIVIQYEQIRELIIQQEQKRNNP